MAIKIKRYTRRAKTQEAILNSTPKNKGEAREQAIVWQEWQSNRSMSWGEVAWWNNYFKKLGKKFGLTEEFKENGII